MGRANTGKQKRKDQDAKKVKIKPAVGNKHNYLLCKQYLF